VFYSLAKSRGKKIQMGRISSNYLVFFMLFQREIQREAQIQTKCLIYLGWQVLGLKGKPSPSQTVWF
jgi:hypothetical protein